MSGRIRSIKPELLEDAVTAGLTDTAFRLFIACILLADDEGNFRAEPKLLEGLVYWRTTPAGDVATALADLGKPAEGKTRPLVHLYTVDGQRYGHIVNWAKHQRISHKGAPRVPGPPEPVRKSHGGVPEALRRDSGNSPKRRRKLSGEPPEGRRLDLRSGSPIPITITDQDPSRAQARTEARDGFEPSDEAPTESRDPASAVVAVALPAAAPATPKAAEGSGRPPGATEPSDASTGRPGAAARGAALGDFGMAADAYREGVSAATRKPCHALDWRARQALEDALATYAEGRTGQALLDWLRADAAAYVRATAHAASYQRGYHPAKWAEWHAAGCPPAPVPSARGAPARAHRQAVPEDAEWLDLENQERFA